MKTPLLYDVVRPLRLTLAESKALIGFGNDLDQLTVHLVGIKPSTSKKENHPLPSKVTVMFTALRGEESRQVEKTYTPKTLPRTKDDQTLYALIENGEPLTLWRKMPLPSTVPELYDQARLEVVIEMIEDAHGPQDLTEENIGRVAVRLQGIETNLDSGKVIARNFKVVLYHREIPQNPYATFELSAGFNEAIEQVWLRYFDIRLFALEDSGWKDVFVREGFPILNDITPEEMERFLDQGLALEKAHKEGYVEMASELGNEGHGEPGDRYPFQVNFSGVDPEPEFFHSKGAVNIKDYAAKIRPLPTPTGEQRDQDLAIVDQILRQYAPLPVGLEVSKIVLVKIFDSALQIFALVDPIKLRIETGICPQRGAFAQVEAYFDDELSECAAVIHGGRLEKLKETLNYFGLQLPEQGVSMILTQGA